jgi:hypothetical protein
MASALTALANASATLNLPTAGTTTDPVTGNIRANTETATVELFLRQATMEPTDLPGINVEGDVLEGYAMDALDARIQPGTVGTLLYSGTTHRCEILATREPFGTTGLIGSTLQSVLGDRVRLIRYRQAA